MESEGRCVLLYKVSSFNSFSSEMSTKYTPKKLHHFPKVFHHFCSALGYHTCSLGVRIPSWHPKVHSYTMSKMLPKCHKMLKWCIFSVDDTREGWMSQESESDVLHWMHVQQSHIKHQPPKLSLSLYFSFCHQMLRVNWTGSNYFWWCFTCFCFWSEDDKFVWSRSRCIIEHHLCNISDLVVRHPNQEEKHSQPFVFPFCWS